MEQNLFTQSNIEMGANKAESLSICPFPSQASNILLVIRNKHIEDYNLYQQQLEPCQSPLHSDSNFQSSGETTLMAEFYTQSFQNWTKEHFLQIQHLDLSVPTSILKFIYYFPLPMQQLNLSAFEQQSAISRLLSLVQETDALPLSTQKEYSSLFVPYFPNTSGQLIFREVAKLLHMPLSLFKHNYRLSPDMMKLFKHKVSYEAQRDLDTFPLMQSLRQLLQEHAEFLDMLRLQASCYLSENPQRSAELGLSIDDPHDQLVADDLDAALYKEMLKAMCANYSHTVKERPPRQSFGQRKQRYSTMQEEIQEEQSKVRKILHEVGGSDEESDFNQSQYLPPLVGQNTQSQTCPQRKPQLRTIRDYLDQAISKPRNPQKRRLSPYRALKRKRDKSSQRQKLRSQVPKHKEHLSSYTVKNKTQKSNWSSILDYCDGRLVNSTIQQSSFNNKEQQHHKAAQSLDSMFYKNYSFLESHFKKQEEPIADLILQRLKSFSLRDQQQKFLSDNHFKSYISQAMLKLQNNLALHQATYESLTLNEEIQIDSKTYKVNCADSILEAWSQYLGLLSQIINCGRPLLLDKLCTVFGIMWHLVTTGLQQIGTHLKRIGDQLFNVFEDFEMQEFMTNKQNDYQLTILMQVFLILDLLQQQSLFQEQTNAFMQYCLAFILRLVLNLNLDLQRGLLKKDLRDVVLILQILSKVYSHNYTKAIASSVVNLYKGLSEGQGINRGQTFGQWMKYRHPCISFDTKDQSKQVEIVMYTYSVMLLLTDVNTRVFGSQKCMTDWPSLISVLDTHKQRSLCAFSQLLLSQVLMIMTDSSSNLTQDQFIQLFHIFAFKVQHGHSSHREILNNLLNKLFTNKQEAASKCPSQLCSHELQLLELFLVRQDQKVIKQLYSKITTQIKDQLLLFKVQVVLAVALENKQQCQIIFKKCTQLAYQYQRENPTSAFENGQMIIYLIHFIAKFDNCDQSEQVTGVNGLLQGFLDNYYLNVVKQRNKLSNNEFLLKNEDHLVALLMIFKALNQHLSRNKGKWKHGEFTWINVAILERIFNLYSCLIVRPGDLENIYHQYIQALGAILHKRIYSRQLTPKQSPSQLEVFDYGNHEESEECCDQLLQECLVYEEQDQLLSQHISRSPLRSYIDNFICYYMKEGKDIQVLLGLFSLSGKIDGILIESKEIRSYQIVSKVQGGKYGQISESFFADSKPMFLANLCCAYLKNVYVRCGVSEISGADSLSNKSDKTQRGLVMQLNYHMLEHLVRGLLHKDSSSKKNHKAFKLYGALKKLGVQSMIFNDALETQIFKLFIESDPLEEEGSYKMAQTIFRTFFNEVSQYYEHCSTKPLLADVLYKYVALVPILCKQYIDQQTQKDEYVDFLKSIMLYFMVSFQSISNLHQNLSGLMNQVIEIVMPTFFKQPDQSLQSVELPSEAFYFYQYLNLQFQSNPTLPGTLDNMRLLLDLLTSTIENNLNILIPSLLLKRWDKTKQIINYVCDECQVLSEFVQQISSHGCEQFLSALLKLGLSYLDISCAMHQLTILRSQRKAMSLLILYTMLTAHLKKPKALIVKAFQELTTNLIGQALNDGRFNKTSVQQNLNILVLLMSVRVAAYKYNMFDLKPSLAFICQLIFALVEEEDQRNNKDNKDKTKIQLTFESLRQAFPRQISRNSAFLTMSAHQFILADAFLIVDLILDNVLKILQKANLNVQTISLLSLLKIYLNDPSQCPLAAAPKLRKGLDSIVQIATSKDLPHNFRTVSQLYL